MLKSKSVILMFFSGEKFKKVCMNIFIYIIYFRERIKECICTHKVCVCGPYPYPCPSPVSDGLSLAVRGRPDRGGNGA